MSQNSSKEGSISWAPKKGLEGQEINELAPGIKTHLHFTAVLESAPNISCTLGQTLWRSRVFFLVSHMTAQAAIKSQNLKPISFIVARSYLDRHLRQKLQYVEYLEPSSLYSSPDIIVMVYDSDHLY